MKKLFICIFCLSILLMSCSDGTPRDYVIQQDDDDDDTFAGRYDIDIQLGNVFNVLQPNGEIDETNYSIINNQECLDELPKKKYEADSTFSLLDFETTDFSNAAIYVTFLITGDMNVCYNSTYNGNWVVSTNMQYLPTLINSHNLTYEYKGENITMPSLPPMGDMTMEDVTYYKYDGYNPFYKVESMYNQATITDSTERGMERFIFYRYTSNVYGMPVDTMLMALDTYTSLLFTYAVPSSLSIFNAPENWLPIDVVPIGINDETRPFFEYDPIGYVNKDHNFVFFASSEEGQETNNSPDVSDFYPDFSSTSPYLIEAEAKNVGN